MPQVIQIKRGATIPGVAAVADGELALRKTAAGELYAGDGAGVLTLVSPARQVEIATVQTILGAKTIDVGLLKVPGGTTAGQLLSTTDPVAGTLAFVDVTIPPAPVFATNADMDDVAANLNVTEHVNPANVRFLVGGQLSTLNTLDKTAIIAAINSLKAEVDLIATGAKFVGTFDAAAATADFTAASGLTDGPLPLATAVPIGAYVINETVGTDPAGAPTGEYGPGDWLISDGTVWTHLDFSAAAGGAILASGVTVSPLVAGGDDVQEVLTLLDAKDTALQAEIDVAEAAIALLPTDAELALLYEPIVTAGAATSFWAGDKTWKPALTQADADLVYEPIIAPAAAVAADKIWQGDKTWILKTSLPPSTAQIAIDAGQDTRLTAIEGAVALLPTDAEIAAAYEPIVDNTGALVTQYWSGLKTWVALPAATATLVDGVSIIGDGLTALTALSVNIVDGGTY